MAVTGTSSSSCQVQANQIRQDITKIKPDIVKTVLAVRAHINDSRNIPPSGMNVTQRYEGKIVSAAVTFASFNKAITVEAGIHSGRMPDVSISVDSKKAGKCGEGFNDVVSEMEDSLKAAAEQAIDTQEIIEGTVGIAQMDAGREVVIETAIIPGIGGFVSAGAASLIGVAIAANNFNPN